MSQSLVTPVRRLVLRCRPCNPIPPAPSHIFQRRHASSSSGDDNSSRPNPVLEEYLKKHPEARSTNTTPSNDLGGAPPAAGDIATSSIFEDERRLQQNFQSDDEPSHSSDRNPQVMARILDPSPNARERWQRRQVIQLVRRGGRVSREHFIKRTEREHLSKSPTFKTSVKKLGMLARQIAGKPLDEAILQMRFSKKKVARDVLSQLEFARDEAMVMRGMGLGLPNTITASSHPTDSSTSTDSTDSTDPSSPSTASLPAPISIQLPSGKRHTISDPSKMYISQAWVGRGPYGQLPDFRARGRVYMLRTPWTSLSVVLKEEATRIREFNDREARRAERRAPHRIWTPLPDRPVPVKKGWYSW